MPRVIVWSRPSGLPMATTSSPTLTLPESPSCATGSVLLESSRSSATSSTGSRPITRAATLAPLSSVTDIEAAPSTTWALVSTSPARSMMRPEPTIVSNRRCGRILLIFIAWMDTTAGDTRSNSAVNDSVQVCAPATAGSRTSASASIHRISRMILPSILKTRT